MSLNRTEQMVLDYLQSHSEERHYWLEKVRRTSASSADEHEIASSLERDLWSYFEERSAVAEPFKGVARREGIKRTSMRNLAEYLLRLWAPRAKKKPVADHPFG
jgi:hypothetical protein